MSRRDFYITVGLLSLAGYAWIAWNGTGLASRLPVQPICLFKAITHLPCPSCGTTRAIMLLLKGDLGGSLLLNPLGAVLFMALAFTPLWLLADVLMKKETLRQAYTVTENMLRRKAWVSVSLIFLIIANWFWNIAKSR